MILESRLVFAEEIFDWTDNYTEILQSQDTPEAKRALDAIGSLWIEYATMEQNLRQWKKVVKVYDDALNDPVASKASRVYLAYAEFCKFRGKISSAQKIYIKGLTAGLLEEQADRIWQDFLQTMRENGSPELSAEQLFAAVSSQVDSGSLTKPSLTLLAGLQKNSSDDFLLEEPASKRFKTEEAQSDTGLTESNFISPATRLSELLEKGIAETKPELGIRLPALTDLHEVSGLTVVDILTLHTSRPTMLFRSLNPENLKVILSFHILTSTFSKLRFHLLLDSVTFTKISLGSWSSILICPFRCFVKLNVMTQVRFFLCLLNIFLESKISRVLDIIEALWINQGLNERYFDQWFSSVIQAQMKEVSVKFDFSNVIRSLF